MTRQELILDIKKYIDKNRVRFSMDRVDSKDIIKSDLPIKGVKFTNVDINCDDNELKKEIVRFINNNKSEDTFSTRLISLIDESHKTDVEIYKKANIDRKLFSKIRSDKYYSPSKNTIFAFIIALELDMKQAEDLLISAGMYFSSSIDYDLIIRYFIEKKTYDIELINSVLFEMTGKCMNY